jgi:hypothetical protein
MGIPETTVTVFTKTGGPLTKRIALAADGTIKSNGSACTMARGRAQRVKVASVTQLAVLIENLRSNQALALGTLRADLPDEVTVVTKHFLNGAKGPDVIARTANDIVYRQGRSAFVLLDFDTKGMPPKVAEKIAAHGGFWEALVTVLPALSSAARVIRRSTSAGLTHADKPLPRSGGLHGYVVTLDGTDAERFLKTLHERCCLADLGWMMVGAGGQLLERSIVDRMVGAPERLVFEGAPVLEPPLGQERESRRPIISDGEALDTIVACPPLSVAEKAQYNELKEERPNVSRPDQQRPALRSLNVSPSPSPSEPA